MILKINGVPVEEIVKEGVEVGVNITDMYNLIHIPVVVDFNWFKLDLNAFNIPDHLYHGVSSLF